MNNKLLSGIAVLAAIFTLSAQNTSEELISNGNFAELSKQKIGGQETMFPKKWELYGNTRDWKIIKTGKGNEVYTKGVLTIGIAVPKNQPEGSFYNLVIRAKGTGKIGIRTWS